MPLAKGNVNVNAEAVAEANEKLDDAEGAGAESEVPFDADTAVIEQDLQEQEAAVATAESEAAAKAALSGQQLAEAIPTAAVATTTAPRNSVMQKMDESGFEGMDLGYGSFPNISLKNEGRFFDSDENDLGTEFRCVVQYSKAKYLIKNTKCDKKDEDAVYTYDLVTVANDAETPIQEIIDDWTSQGWGWEKKPYIEVGVLWVGDEEDEKDGEMMLLSIPPASRRTFSGKMASVQMKAGLMPNQFILKCFVGKKITHDKGDFYPWKFAYEGKA